MGGSGNGVQFATVAEIAELLQVPRSWVYARTATNEIPHVRMGRYVRFKRGEVLQWVAAGCPSALTNTRGE